MQDPDLTGDVGTTDDGAADSNAGGSPDYEQLAREKGWKPKDEYEGEQDSWVGAEEYVKRRPLFDKMKHQSKKIKELEKTVEAMAKHYQANVQQAKQQAIDDLKAQRKEAIELGDAIAVERIDEKIDVVKKAPEPEFKPKQADPEIVQFVADNSSWFNVDEDMTTFAVTFNETYLKKHPESLEKSLSETLKAVKLAFPDKFINTKKQAPSPVEGGNTPASGGGKYSMARLSSEQKLVYHQLVKIHKQMSHEDYFKSLEDAGFLEN